ncbi:MAG: OmpA family protein [bacterium]|jgi:OmpA-OmpF porin, OOP family
MKPIHIIALFLACLIGYNMPAQVIPFSSQAKKVENEIKRHKKEDKKKKEEAENEQAKSDETSLPDDNGSNESQDPQLVWSKYDFIPGDKVIFEDDLSGEENGEFPSRWDLKEGNVEVAEFGGENVIMFRDGHPTIMPYMKNPSEDYLPEVFTIEFDLYCGTDNFVTYLYDRKYQKSGSPSGYTYLNIKYYQMEFGTSSSRHPDEKTLEKRRWIHVAIAYNKGKLKAYMDETRLINIPRIDFDPKGLSLHSYHCRNDNLYYVKNIRIAAGGKKYYDRIMEEGRIVANGIRFDSGRATLKPESMGIINEMVEVMEDHPDLKIIIEGHTDSDGEENANLKLSEERANTVMLTMTKMGISADRMETAGFGESRPIDTNDTAEGKANNRRVEFVKTEAVDQ